MLFFPFLLSFTHWGTLIFTLIVFAWWYPPRCTVKAHSQGRVAIAPDWHAIDPGFDPRAGQGTNTCDDYLQDGPTALLLYLWLTPDCSIRNRKPALRCVASSGWWTWAWWAETKLLQTVIFLRPWRCTTPSVYQGNLVLSFFFLYSGLFILLYSDFMFLHPVSLLVSDFFVTIEVLIIFVVWTLANILLILFLNLVSFSSLS
jgi:hypothetical protein